MQYTSFRGPAIDLRVGFHHGLYCVACCWGSLHIHAERVNSDHTSGSDPDFSQFPQDFVHIDASGLFTELVASVWSASTSPRSRTLTWILHDTGSDRLGITAIYLSLIDMHVVVTMLRIGRGSFSSRLEIPD
jgi:hypothetical protein